LRVTASLGVATSTGDRDETVDQLLQRADEALYAAKESGRDRVCVSRARP
jgi:diguanylate cyclase (GGDEF)-like protein